MIKVINIEGLKGGFEITCAPDGIDLSDLIQGASSWMLGSTIQIQEILTITTRIDKVELVNIDETWYPFKVYAGSWRLFDSNGFYVATAGDEGFITAETYKIKRYSSYQIGIGQDQQFAITGGGQIGACNAYLVPEIYLFPNEITPRPGFRFINKEPQFIFESTQQPAPLRDITISQRIGGAGIYLKPGMVGVGAIYEISAINLVQSDFPLFNPPTCSFLDPTCQQQFQAFLLLEAAGGTCRYFSDAEAASAYKATLGASSTFESLIYVCQTDPTVQFPYYRVCPNNDN